MAQAVGDRLVSIVLPVYNQADHIGSVVREYEQALSKVHYDHELVLVVNGSTDASLDVCRGLAQQYPTIRVVHSERGGWGLAVKLGLRAARGDTLCFTNSARTSANDLLVLIYFALVNGNALVKPHRHSRESPTRKIGSFLYNLECRALFDLATWDINATPKIFSREIYNVIQPKSDGDLIDLEVYAKCRQADVPILEVPVYALRRFGGQSTTKYKSAAKMYWGAFKLAQRVRKNGR